MDSPNNGGGAFSYAFSGGGSGGRSHWNWWNKVRANMSQFNDLFSEFSRYIAPAYHHDKCERSVQMRLYAMNKREFVVVFMALFMGLILVTFIGLSGPPITVASEQRVSKFTPPMNKSQLATGPFVFETPKLTSYNQQLWVMARIVTSKLNDETVRKELHASVSLSGVVDTEHIATILHRDRSHNKSREISCHTQICDEFIILHLGYLSFNYYVATVQFYGLESFDDKYGITDVIFYFKSYNPAFTQIEIWFRLIYLFMAFSVEVWFVLSLRRFHSYNWSIEQKWIAILLPMLILYNDPLYPLTFLMNSSFPRIMDAIFQASFLSCLLLFWICIYHGIRQNERHWLRFYMIKFVLVGLLWLSSVILSCWLVYHESKDPTYDGQLIDTANFHGYKVFFFTVGGAYVAYLLYLIIQAYSELRAMPHFDKRLKFMTLLMLIVLTMSAAFTVLRFGVKIIEDNFVAELKTNYKSSVEFMAFYGLLNFYLFTMAYVYSPSKNAALEPHFKDNPTLSMLNDSDEDVLYGSDAEDRPLAAAGSGDHEESD